MADMPAHSYTIDGSGAKITGKVQNLQYAGNDSRYTFYWRLYKYDYSSSSWYLFVDIGWGVTSSGGSAGSGWATRVTDYVDPAGYVDDSTYAWNQYYLSCAVYWNGTYQAGFAPSSGIFPTIPNSSITSQGVQKTTISFDYTQPRSYCTGNLMAEVWNGSSYVDRNDSGLPNSVSAVTDGFNITFTSLVPNLTHYFRTRIKSGSYYSGYQFQATTNAWPSVPSAPTVNSRFEGGLNLSWGDHSYEGSSFDYCLRCSGNLYRFTDNVNNDMSFGEYGVSKTFDVCAGIYAYSPSGGYGWYTSGSYTSSGSFYTAPKSPSSASYSSTTKSLTITINGMSGTYSGVAVDYRVYGSGSGWTSTWSTAGASITISDLVHNTTYECRIYGYLGSPAYLNSVSYAGGNLATALLTVGNPSNISVSQYGYTLLCELIYSWGSNATGMDFQWGNDASNWTAYTNQSNNNYPSANYSVDGGTYGNKYFQVRSRRTDGYNTVLSGWFNASPYPILTIDTPPYRTKIFVGNNPIAKPCKVYIGGSWVTKPMKYYDVGTGSWK